MSGSIPVPISPGYDKEPITSVMGGHKCSEEYIRAE